MPDIPVYSYEDLRKKADEFLRKYHPSGDIPVPIEEMRMPLKVLIGSDGG